MEIKLEDGEDLPILSCPERSAALLGQPLGQYHCPHCGAMCIAGVAHPTDKEVREQGLTPYGESRQADLEAVVSALGDLMDFVEVDLTGVSQKEWAAQREWVMSKGVDALNREGVKKYTPGRSKAKGALPKERGG